jgi:hypothetical protein
MGQVAVSAPERRALAPSLAPHAPPGRMPGVYAGRQPLAEVRGGRAALARVLHGVAQWERAGRARGTAPRRAAAAADEAVDARRQQCYADVRAPPAPPAPRAPSAPRPQRALGRWVRTMRSARPLAMAAAPG